LNSGTSLLLLSILFQLFFQGFQLHAQDESVLQDVQFLPNEFYVGDLVEMRGILPSAGNLRLPEEFPQTDWLQFEDVEIISNPNGSYQVRIRFISFAPGNRTLPTIELGAVSLSGLKIYTQSLVTDDTTTTAAPLGQLLLPGTYSLLLGVLAALIIVPIILYLMIRKIVSQLMQFFIRYRLQRPLKKILAEIKTLRNMGYPPRILYTRMVDNLKNIFNRPNTEGF
jgi:hypothetical protein